MYQLPLLDMESQAENITSTSNTDGQNGAPTKKRRCESRDDTVATPNNIGHRMRILSRRYNLTRTGYKYVEIEIGITSTKDRATVDIALGDANGREILLSPAMWRRLVDNKTRIHDYLARTTDDPVTPTPVHLDDLTIRFATINRHRTIRLDTASGRVTMSATARYLLGLQYCVDRIIRTMSNAVGRAEIRLRRFRDITAEIEDSSRVTYAVRGIVDFDKNDLIDCELHAIVFLPM